MKLRNLFKKTKELQIQCTLKKIKSEKPFCNLKVQETHAKKNSAGERRSAVRANFGIKLERDKNSK